MSLIENPPSTLSIPIEPRFNLLAVINPKSGSGQALKVFKEVIEPEWKRRNIAYQTLTTQFKWHATIEIANNRNITDFTSIIAIGGDGTLAEVIAGLKYHRWVSDADKILSIGIIPLGSGNGLAKSLLFHANRKYDILEATKMTSYGITQKLDLFEATQKEKSMTGFLAVTMGVIADIDIWSEPYRYLGSYRFYLGAIMSLWKMKAYPARLSYLPEKSQCKRIPKLHHPLPAEFKVVEGRFTLIMIGNTSHCSSNAHTTPGAKINDGYLHVVVIREITRWTLLNILCTIDSGNYVQNPCVLRFKTKLLRLEPLNNDPTLTLDGEQLPVEPLQCRVEKAAIKVLCC